MSRPAQTGRKARARAKARLEKLPQVFDKTDGELLTESQIMTYIKRVLRSANPEPIHLAEGM